MIKEKKMAKDLGKINSDRWRWSLTLEFPRDVELSSDLRCVAR